MGSWEGGANEREKSQVVASTRYSDSFSRCWVIRSQMTVFAKKNRNIQLQLD